MKNITIKILKAKVLLEIHATSAYAGYKTEKENPGREFDRIATVEEDAELLGRYWEDACCTVADKLRDFIVSADFGIDCLSLNLEVSSAYDDSLTTAVESGIFSYIVAEMTSRWFRLTFAEKAEEWAREGNERLESAVGKLYHRRKPKRFGAGV